LGASVENDLGAVPQELLGDRETDTRRRPGYDHSLIRLGLIHDLPPIFLESIFARRAWPDSPRFLKPLHESVLRLTAM
jgi:hypothetical protein